ncbi:hypothetical protein RND81_10G145700 [Saponaria officinalis]|uniref:GRF-type domain-containing protein n=1 Tax=Saponaria officinalis TaxID=3572 RepID=A0AAW1I3B4_SAPOF
MSDSNSYSSSRCSCECPRVCFCDRVVANITSWTKDNPNRIFEACPIYNPLTKTRGCKYFRWLDKTQTGWQKKVINQLVIERKFLQNEVGMLKKENDMLKNGAKMMKVGNIESESVEVANGKEIEGCSVEVANGKETEGFSLVSNIVPVSFRYLFLVCLIVLG